MTLIVLQAMKLLYRQEQTRCYHIISDQLYRCIALLLFYLTFDFNQNWLFRFIYQIIIKTCCVSKIIQSFNFRVDFPFKACIYLFIYSHGVLAVNVCWLFLVSVLHQIDVVCSQNEAKEQCMTDEITLRVSFLLCS